MKAVSKIAIGAVGVAALIGAAAPAAAQYYPGNPYGYNQPGNVIGQVLGQVLNPYGGQQYGGQYGYQQNAVQQCTAAVQHRLSRQYSAGYGGYGQYGGGQYGSPYGYNTAPNSARVLAVTRVEQRSRSTLRVRGVATSGMGYGYGGYPYGGHSGGPGGYGNPYGGYGSYGGAQGDLSFRCDVDYRGQVRDVDIDRRR